LMEERFPEKLDLAIIQEHAEDIERLLNEQGMSDIDKSLIVIKIMRALMFVNQLAVDWHYNGNNVSLDDTNTPIFWYRPVNTEMYRVIYRDLHIENVPLENLPERP